MPPCEASATLEPHAHRRMGESPGLQQANWQALLASRHLPYTGGPSPRRHTGEVGCSVGAGGRATRGSEGGWGEGDNLDRFTFAASCRQQSTQGDGTVLRLWRPWAQDASSRAQAPPAAPAAALLTEAVAWGCLVSVHRQAAHALRQRRPPRLPGPAALPPAAGVGPHSSGAVAGELAGLCHTGSDQTMTNGRRGVQLPLVDCIPDALSLKIFSVHTHSICFAGWHEMTAKEKPSYNEASLQSICCDVFGCAGVSVGRSPRSSMGLMQRGGDVQGEGDLMNLCGGGRRGGAKEGAPPPGV